MEFRQVQYFVCLYEEGSVTRAARRLNIVQPALSMQIAKLEDALGRPLFERTPQGMKPTREGRRMYGLFRPVLGEYEQARAQMLQTSSELAGPVRIGVIETIAEGVLVDALKEFSARHPKVELSLTNGFSATLTDAVSIGQLDAAIINKPRRPLALSSAPIAREDLLLVTGSAHPRMAKNVPFARLAELKLVLPTRQHGLRGIIESFAQAEDVALAPSVEIDSISAILRLVRESAFCALLPRIALGHRLAGSGLKGHRVIAPQLTRQLVRITHPRRPLNPAATAFMEALERHVRGIGVKATPAPARSG
jgi:DNA-binding transcriptional LysR family regulator